MFRLWKFGIYLMSLHAPSETLCFFLCCGIIQWNLRSVDPRFSNWIISNIVLKYKRPLCWSLPAVASNYCSATWKSNSTPARHCQDCIKYVHILLCFLYLSICGNALSKNMFFSAHKTNRLKGEIPTNITAVLKSQTSNKMPGMI